MYEVDRASQGLGITLERAEPGIAVTAMKVDPNQCNGLGVCHGGLIFTLADTAMAFATNADGSGSFATNAEIDFINPAHAGDELRATCNRLVHRGKASVNDVVVTNQDNVVIAVFRGRTLSTGAPVTAGNPVS